MTIHWKLLTPDRVELCAALWSDRRAYSAAEFSRALSRLQTLLEDDRAIGAVIFEDECVRAFGVTVFVDHAVADAWLAAPRPQFGKRLLLEDDLRSGQSAVLDTARIGQGNAGSGLQLAVVNTNYDNRARDVDGVIGSVIEAFLAVHRGYRITRIINEVNGDNAVAVAASSGSFERQALFSDVGGVKGLSSALFTLTRQQAAAWRNPLLAMFVYSPPRICFTDAERSILRAALTGNTDGAIARRLQVPETAVKSRWSRLQERAFAATPDLFPNLGARALGAGRGPQNRHLILEYVRLHPSELTPYRRPHTSHVVAESRTARRR